MCNGCLREIWDHWCGEASQEANLVRILHAIRHFIIRREIADVQPTGLQKQQTTSIECCCAATRAKPADCL